MATCRLTQQSAIPCRVRILPVLAARLGINPANNGGVLVRAPFKDGALKTGEYRGNHGRKPVGPVSTGVSA